MEVETLEKGCAEHHALLCMINERGYSCEAKLQECHTDLSTIIFETESEIRTYILNTEDSFRALICVCFCAPIP